MSTATAATCWSGTSVVFRSTICVLDRHIVTMFVGLLVLAVASQIIGPLQALTRHGKARQDNKTKDAFHVWQWIAQGDAWMVRKQYFLHFYVWGTLWFGMVAMQHWPGDDTKTLPPPRVAQGLVLLHLLQRWYECVYVHQWRSSSQMHVAVYVLGLLYYTLLPFIFGRVDHSQWCDVTHSQGRESEQYSTKTSSSLLLAPRWSIPWRIAAVMLCLYAKHEQARHHQILANLRRGEQTKTNDKQQRRQVNYSLPHGGWFTWVACPHYLAEILFYLGLAMLLEDMARATVIVAWVTISLTLNAMQTQAWYQQHIPNYAQYKRRAIFPFIL